MWIISKDYTKCFNFFYWKPNGICERTSCGYTPIKSQTINKIKQESLIIPCPVSNKLEVTNNE